MLVDGETRNGLEKRVGGHSFTSVTEVNGGKSMTNVADEPDQPNVFVAVASASTDSLNWNGYGIEEDGKSQSR